MKKFAPHNGMIKISRARDSNNASRNANVIPESRAQFISHKHSALAVSYILTLRFD